MSDKPLRAAMPTVTAFVDAFRDAGLTNNDAIREGMRNGGFYAREGGHTIGKRIDWEEGVQPVLSMEAEARILDLQWKRSREARR